MRMRTYSQIANAATGVKESWEFGRVRAGAGNPEMGIGNRGDGQGSFGSRPSEPVMAVDRTRVGLVMMDPSMGLRVHVPKALYS